ncbi:MAG: 50S ribosomal protein L30 [Myxococcales bacterium]|jgi:large subunit ribosomal protein L30|nr:50S ribosomal protein L30 [Myxococcales bacterium]
MALKLKVTLIRSGINRPEDQKQTIKALGLTKMHRSNVLKDTDAVRGMIRKVSHLVKVEPVE